MAGYDYGMPPLILLGVLVGLPLVVTVLLRIKPLYIFVSIICGYFWALFLGDPAELMLRSLVHVNHFDVIIRIILLLLPILMTLLLMRRTLSASALPFQIGLLAADSILLATFLVPLMTPGVQASLYQTNTGNVLRQGHDVLIAGIVGIHVLVMWFMRPRHGDAGHGHHGKHKKH